MHILKSMNQEEITKYLLEKPEEFLVIEVRSDLISLINGPNFEKFFIKTSQSIFPNDSVLSLQSAAIKLFQAGFSLDYNLANGVFHIQGQVGTELPLPFWAEFLKKIIAPLFEGEVQWLLRHIKTGEIISALNNSENLRNQRESFGVNPDRSIEEELMRILKVE